MTSLSHKDELQPIGRLSMPPNRPVGLVATSLTPRQPNSWESQWARGIFYARFPASSLAKRAIRSVQPQFILHPPFPKLKPQLLGWLTPELKKKTVGQKKLGRARQLFISSAKSAPTKLSNTSVWLQFPRAVLFRHKDEPLSTKTQRRRLCRASEKDSGTLQKARNCCRIEYVIFNPFRFRWKMN